MVKAVEEVKLHSTMEIDSLGEVVVVRIGWVLEYRVVVGLT